MSPFLATELFQGRRDAAIATSKLLLENSGYELRNAPINANTLFYNKIKEVAKSNYEGQQQRFIASSSTITNVQMYNNKSLLIWLSDRLKDLDCRVSQLDLNRHNRTGLKLKPSPLRLVLERTILRGIVTRDNSPPLNRPLLPQQSSESQPFPLPILPYVDILVGGRLAHFVEQWGELTNNKWVLSII